MVDLKAWVDVDEEELGINEKVYYPVLEKILEENTDIEEIKQAIKRDIHDLIPKHITKKIFSLPSTTTCIWNTAQEMPMISTTWATVESVP